MNDKQAFINAIVAAPSDALPRLIFADWLDEHGNPGRAEFIRVQCELARDFDPYEHAPRAEPLRSRQQQLFASCPRLAEELPCPLTLLLTPQRDTIEPANGYLRRGFVEHVQGPADYFLRHAGDLLKATPVREVTLMTWPSQLNGVGYSRLYSGRRSMLRVMRGMFPGIKINPPPADRHWLIPSGVANAAAARG